jgi:DNA repair exonuclease SbcCD ATPase subunit
MSDDNVTTDTGDMFSKEYVEKLKADLAAKSDEAAKLKAFKATHDEKTREVIGKLQPDIQACIESLAKENEDHAAEMKPLVDWSRSCHESQSIETAMPLARLVSCASAKIKRTREEASILSEKATTLGATLKELEELKTADSAKAQRINELEALANERQDANQKLQDELAKLGVIKDKFDFSKVASREAAPPASDIKPEAIAGTSNLTALTSNASRGTEPVAFEDQLLKFVTGNSTKAGSSKITQSSTIHPLVGASSGGVEDEIASAIRGY